MNHPGIPDPSACQAAREGMLDYLEFVRPAGRVQVDPTGFHCDACRAWFERARRQADAMARMPRRLFGASALDGLVVAELNAGRRQERAAAALASLKRLEAPVELEALIRDRMLAAIRSAPDELERRVAFELAAGPSPRTERQLSSLTRLSAPAELDRLVARSLEHSARSPRPESLPLRRWMAVAASLFVLFGAAALARQFNLFPHQPRELRVIHTNSTASLDLESRRFLSDVTGGYFEAVR